MTPLNQTDPPQIWTTTGEPQQLMAAALVELLKEDEYTHDSPAACSGEEELLFGLGYIPSLLASSD